MNVPLPDEEATEALGRRLAGLVRGPDGTTAGARIHLRGELGSGKTTLVRALLRAAGVTGRIRSPSYTLLETYNVSRLNFHHFDFYRFSDAHEWRDAGFSELLDDQAIVLIEWPEQAGTRLPAPDLDIEITYRGTGRQARLVAGSKKGQGWLTHLHTPRT